MQIERMNKGQWGKVRAFFDLRTEEGMVVKGFRIVDGSNGPFVSMPSQKGKDDQYYDTVYAEPQLKDEIMQVAMEAYGSDIVQSHPGYQGAPAAATDPPPFSDDDIPF